MDKPTTEAVSELIRQAGRSMAVGEAGAALEAVTRLEQEFRRRADRGAALPGIWDAFLGLLHRRGYRVSTEAERRDALEEIRQTGAGFDLYDLAEGLARYDTTARECRNAVAYPLFPPLLIFARPCGCGGHERKLT